ncbi:MAG: hypothetical protein PHQ12_04845 [Chthoniobacteraceae bacterium]|nr:hypothetical protein [Chthoniobacteraceae bacterium]
MDFRKSVTLLLDRREGMVFYTVLLVYALLLFVVHGEVKVNCDNPGYTDPAINYVLGNGFTSCCWYAQRWDACWAGNVPLHQFLLIPWFKIFGAGLSAVLWLNFFYVTAGMTLLWRALQKSDLVSGACWRLGAMAFILSTNCCYFLLTPARYDPLSFLLISLAVYLLTVQRPVWRLGGLFLVALLLPWAHLAISAYAALMGCLLLLFYPRHFWKDVFVFGAGGLLGALALVGFYKYMGVWEGFMLSIAPHAMGGDVNTSGGAWRHGGVTSLYYLVTGALLCFLVLFVVRKRPWKFPLFAVVCAVAIPSFLIKLGIFSAYYGWCLLFLLVVFLFSMLANEAIPNRNPLLCVGVLLAFGMVVPGSFWRRTIDNRILLYRTGSPEMQMTEFVKKVLKPKDVALIDEVFYYQARPRVSRTIASPMAFADFNGRVSYPGRKEDVDALTVCILGDLDNRPHLTRLPTLRFQPPGQWSPTGEELGVWGWHFVVFRRTDRP